MPQAMGKELVGYMEVAAQTRRSPQSLVGWGSASPSPAPEGWEELFLGWSRCARSLGVAWAAGNWHMGTTTLMASRTPSPPHQHLHITVSMAPRTSPPHQHPGHHCPMAPRTSLSHQAPRVSPPRCLLSHHPRRCHPMPGQRCLPSLSTLHHGPKEPGWSHGHPTAPGDS